MEMRALLSAVVALMLVAGSPFLADAGAAEDTMITTKVKSKLTTDRVKNLCPSTSTRRTASFT
jgi:hypothetical protein